MYALARDYTLQRATRIDPSKVDVLGSDANLFVGSQSVVNSALVRQLAYKTNALLLTGARGTDLDRLGFDRYQQPRKGASAALGAVRMFRQSSALGSGTVQAGTILQTGTNVLYVTTQPATFGSTQLDNVVATIRAVQAGKSTQVGANQIVRFQNSTALFDPTIQVNNDNGTAGGEDAEDDDTYRNRLFQFWNAARRGTLGAIEFGARSVPGVVSANATEALNSLGGPARVVILYIADSSGVASDALAAQVQVALGDYRAAGIQVIIVNSLPELVAVQLQLAFVGNVDTVTLTTQVLAAVVNFVNSLPVNGPLYRGQLFSVLQRFASSGVVPSQGAILAPVGDLFPPLGETFRTTQSLVQNVMAA